MTSIATSTDIANEVRKVLAALAEPAEPLRLTGGPLFRDESEPWIRPLGELRSSVEQLRGDAIAGYQHWFADWYDAAGTLIPLAERPERWFDAELEGADVRALQAVPNSLWRSTSGNLFVSRGTWVPVEETTLGGEPAFVFISMHRALQIEREAEAARDAAVLDEHPEIRAQMPSWAEDVELMNFDEGSVDFAYVKSYPNGSIGLYGRVMDGSVTVDGAPEVRIEAEGATVDLAAVADMVADMQRRLSGAAS